MLSQERKQELAGKFKQAFAKNKQISLSGFADKHQIPHTTMRRLLSDADPVTHTAWQLQQEKNTLEKEKLIKKVIPFLKLYGNAKTEAEFNLTQAQINQLIAAHNRKQPRTDKVRKSDVTSDLVISCYLDEDLTIDEIASKLDMQKSTVSYHLNHDQLSAEIREKIQEKKLVNKRKQLKTYKPKSTEVIETACKLAEQYITEFVSLNPEFKWHYLGATSSKEIILVTPDGEEILLQIRGTNKKTGEVRTIHDDTKYSKYHSVFIFGVVITEKRPEVYLVPFNKVFNKKYFRLRKNELPGQYRISSNLFSKQILSKTLVPK